MNIKCISDNLLCSGCGTCYAICNHNAIAMKNTPTMGLLYADVKVDRCTDCGLCLRVCPSRNILNEKESLSEEHVVGDIIKCYVGRSLDKEIFNNAQSGGLVTTILSYLFEKGKIDAAISCRMEYSQPIPLVHYSILTDSEELKSNQKSCYTQVDIVSALCEISRFKSVAVVGVPCHIQGLSNLMKLKKYRNITYRIGLICDRTYSDTYMDAIIHGVKIPSGDIKINYRQKNFTFLGKYHSYQQAPTVITNRDAEIAIIPNSKRVFLKNYFTVPKCRICWDKLNSQADIVVGDPWGLTGLYDEKKGDSVIIIRTAIGQSIIDGLNNNNLIAIKEVDIDSVTDGQLIAERMEYISSVNWPNIKKRWNALENSDKQSLLMRVNRKYRIEILKKKAIAVLSKIKHLI